MYKLCCLWDSYMGDKLVENSFQPTKFTNLGWLKRENQILMFITVQFKVLILKYSKESKLDAF